MLELITAAFGLISRHRTAVAIAVFALQLPGQILAQLSRSTVTLGELVGVAGSIVLLVAFLSDGNGKSYPLGRILGALVRAIGSFVIMWAIVVVFFVMLAIVAALFGVVLANATVISSPQVGLVLVVILGLLAFVFVAVVMWSLILLPPVCLDESGGSWAALKRSLRLSRSRWLLTWAVVLTVVDMSIPIFLIRSLGGVGPVLISIAMSSVAFVLEVALATAFYRLVAAENPAVIIPQAPLLSRRSRETAASGTFRARRATKRTGRHR